MTGPSSNAGLSGLTGTTGARAASNLKQPGPGPSSLERCFPPQNGHNHTTITSSYLCHVWRVITIDGLYFKAFHLLARLLSDFHVDFCMHPTLRGGTASFHQILIYQILLQSANSCGPRDQEIRLTVL